MEQRIPLATFETSAEAVLMADSEGKICFCSPAAAELLGRERGQILGRPCWTVVCLFTPSGAPFCSHHCPVRRDSLLQIVPPRQRLVRETGGSTRLVDLVTFLIPETGPGPQPVFHLLEPVVEVAQAPILALGNLDSLSPREQEILRLLALGRSTRAVAEVLFISTATVRNHVQRILKKLGVHSRLEAALACIQSSK
jgi:DNA-binding CsgD family transcriptional regulator